MVGMCLAHQTRELELPALSGGISDEALGLLPSAAAMDARKVGRQTEAQHLLERGGSSGSLARADRDDRADAGPEGGEPAAMLHGALGTILPFPERGLSGEL